MCIRGVTATATRGAGHATPSLLALRPCANMFHCLISCWTEPAGGGKLTRPRCALHVSPALKSSPGLPLRSSLQGKASTVVVWKFIYIWGVVYRKRLHDVGGDVDIDIPVYVLLCSPIQVHACIESVIHPLPPPSLPVDDTPLHAPREISPRECGAVRCGLIHRPRQAARGEAHCLGEKGVQSYAYVKPGRRLCVRIRRRACGLVSAVAGSVLSASKICLGGWVLPRERSRCVGTGGCAMPWEETTP